MWRGRNLLFLLLDLNENSWISHYLSYQVSSNQFFPLQSLLFKKTSEPSIVDPSIWEADAGGLWV